MTAAWMAAHDGGKEVDVVVVVTVVVVVASVVVVVGSTSVQSVSAQWLAPVSTMRRDRASSTHDWAFIARHFFAPLARRSTQQTTASRRPHVASLSRPLQRRRNVPARSALVIASRTRAR